MKQVNLIFSFFLLSFTTLLANQVIYKAGTTIINGAWAAPSPTAVASVTVNNPYEGGQHYKLDYTAQGTWAGTGLNMDNWYAGPARNFSNCTHIRLAYRGLGVGDELKLKLRYKSGTTDISGASISIGGNSSTYTVKTIALSSFLTNGLTASAISELNFEIYSPTNATSTVYLDAIEGITITAPAPIANATCLARAASMGKGFNTSNWLEAYWLLQFNTYPVVNDYTRARFQALSQAGFKHVRLPVIFERIANQNPPYTLNTNQQAYYLVDSAIVWANAFNLKLIIDNHHGVDLTDANFATEKNRKCAIWRQLTQRYSYLDPNKFFFEIYNEPNGISNQNWRTVAAAIVDTIRAYNTTHTLIVGGNGWNSMPGLTSFEPLSDPNTIYTFHNYDPYDFTHQGMSWTSPPNKAARAFPLGDEKNEIRSSFIAVKNWGNFYGVPAYMGEFGVASAADATSRCNWVEHITHLSDSLSMPWAYWDAKNYNDAFGFYPNGIITEANAVPCFKTHLKLYQAPLATQDILNINAFCENQNVEIRWESEVFEKNGDFELESSFDGGNWTKISEIPSKLGRNKYITRLESTNENRYFRIVYVAGDGKRMTSTIINITCKAKQRLAVYPNPIGDGDLNINYSFGDAKNVSLMLFNANGQVVKTETFPSNDADNKVTLNIDDLPKGLYILRLLSEDHQVLTTKLSVF